MAFLSRDTLGDELDSDDGELEASMGAGRPGSAFRCVTSWESSTAVSVHIPSGRRSPSHLSLPMAAFAHGGGFASRDYGDSCLAASPAFPSAHPQRRVCSLMAVAHFDLGLIMCPFPTSPSSPPPKGRSWQCRLPGSREQRQHEPATNVHRWFRRGPRRGNGSGGGSGRQSCV